MAKNLLVDGQGVDHSTTTTGTSSSSPWQEILNKSFSSDTTVREVCEDADCKGVLLTLLESQNKTDDKKEEEWVCLWDCTSHPPRDITDWPTVKYKESHGMHSKTLYDAGWFPSGTLRACKKSEGPPMASLAAHDDVQYKLPTTAAKAAAAEASNTDTVQLTGAVQLKETGTATKVPPLPSQVLDSVTKRFDKDKESMTEQEQHALRRQNKQSKRQKEQDRCKKLEARIRKLEETSASSNKKKKGKPVTEQVRRMLIKSRATGAKSLKQQDRVYFHVVVLVEPAEDAMDDNAEDDGSKNNTTEEFRYFSIQDTIARGILSTFRNKQPSKEWESEVLVRRPVTDGSSEEGAIMVYRRLPNTMRVYEAIAQNFLEQGVNKIIVRWYNPARGDEATTSVLEEAVAEDASPTETNSAAGKQEQ